MGRKELMLVVVALAFRQALSQTCPSGTPSACTCNQTVFDCSGAGLSEVPSSLSSATDVVQINLSNNNIATIPTGAFKMLASVTSIDLTNNGISSLSSGAFDTLNMLTSINLANNQLTTLDQIAFNVVPQLREINVDNNAIVCNSDIDWLRLWRESMAGSNPALTGNCADGSGTIAQYLDGLDASAIPTTISFESSSYQANEGESPVSCVVVRRGGVDSEIRFTLSTMNGTAFAGTDFEVPTSSETMPQFQTRIAIDVLIVNDMDIEPNEDFSLQLEVTQRGESNVAVVGIPNSTTVTIIDDDTPVPPPAATTQGSAATSMMDATSNMAATMQPPNPMTTKMMDKMTDKNMDPTPKGTPEPISRDVPVEAIIIPIIVIIIIIVVIIIAVVVYKKRQEDAKTTAG